MRRVAVFVCFVLVAVVLPGRAHAAVAHTVGVIGDSLLSYDNGDLDAQLRAAGWSRSVIDAVPGRRIPSSARSPLSGVKALRELLAEGVDTPYWIIALGTNDIGVLGQGQDARTWITELLDALGPGHQVLWVNADNPRYPEATARFDTTLSQIAAERGIAVLDWTAIVRANPSWLTRDRVHLTSVGYQQRHYLIAQASLALLDNGPIPASAYEPMDGVVAAPAPVRAPAPVSLPAGTLRIGMEGTGVKRLQSFLRSRGYYPHEPQGVFGTVTRLAVKRLQSDLASKGFVPDRVAGLYGPRTRAALAHYLASLQPPAPSAAPDTSTAPEAEPITVP
jgi:hypothetical protein